MPREDKVVFVGSFDSDVNAEAYITGNQFVRDFGDGMQGFKQPTLQPFTGYMYRNTITEGFRIWTGIDWDDLGSGDPKLAGSVYVGTNGSDTEGDGSLDKPYRTVGKGITEVGAGGSVIIGPGTYAEQLLITESINIEEYIKGTATIEDSVAGGAIITVTPPVGGCIVRIDCNVRNTSNTGAGDIAVLVDNTAGNGSALVYVRGEVLDGGNAGTAAQVDGDPGNVEQTQVVIENTEDLTGGILCALETPTDIVRFNNVVITEGPNSFMQIQGTAGEFIIANTLMAAAPNGERIEYGVGGATGVNLGIGSSELAATVELGNIGGTGIVRITGGSQLGGFGAAVGATNQLYQRWNGTDELVAGILESPIGVPVVAPIYTAPAASAFYPHTVRTINKAAPTGPATSIAIDGTGPGTVVAPTGPGPIAPGITNEVVIPDTVINPAPVALNVIGAGLPGEFVDIEVIGKVV
jgi:hypothetical protein